MSEYDGTELAPDGNRYPVGTAPQFDGPVRPWVTGSRSQADPVEVPAPDVIPASQGGGVVARPGGPNPKDEEGAAEFWEPKAPAQPVSGQVITRPSLDAEAEAAAAPDPEDAIPTGSIGGVDFVGPVDPVEASAEPATGDDLPYDDSEAKAQAIADHEAQQAQAAADADAALNELGATIDDAVSTAVAERDEQIAALTAQLEEAQAAAQEPAPEANEASTDSGENGDPAVDPDAPPAPEVTEPPADPAEARLAELKAKLPLDGAEGLSKAEAVELAAALGVEHPKSATRDDIVTKIRTKES